MKKALLVCALLGILGGTVFAIDTTIDRLETELHTAQTRIEELESEKETILKIADTELVRSYLNSNYECDPYKRVEITNVDDEGYVEYAAYNANDRVTVGSCSKAVAYHEVYNK